MQPRNPDRTFLRRGPVLGVIVLLLVSPGALANTNSASRAYETWEQIQARWTNVPPGQVRKAADAGRGDAQYFLGVTEWKAAADANSFAFQQWRIPSRTNVVPPSFPESESSAIRTNWAGVAEEEIRRTAKAGDRGAQRHISMLESDKAIERGRTAFEWMKKAAAQGVVPAEYDVARTFLGQMGWRIVPADTAEGLKWLRKSADDGHPNAQTRLAEMLIGGGEPSTNTASPILSRWLTVIVKFAATTTPRRTAVVVSNSMLMSYVPGISSVIL